MLHIAVVEDDKNYAAQLREYLERYENETKRKLSVSVFSDGEDIEEKDEVCHDPDEGRKGASGCISALLCRGERSRSDLPYGGRGYRGQGNHEGCRGDTGRCFFCHV